MFRIIQNNKMGKYNPDIIIDFPKFKDERGELAVADLEHDIPFDVKRSFWIYNVKQNQIRGKHAHRTCSEVLVALHGSFKVKVSYNGLDFTEYILDEPTKGLLIEPMVWCELYDFTNEAVCLCLASEKYDSSKYVHSLEEFSQEVAVL